MQNKKKLICVYNDDGCLGANTLAEWVEKHIPNATIKFVNAEQIKAGVLTKLNVKALFVPGGESRYYNIKLGKEGRDAIRDFVKSGGFYYGICAGACYAAANIKFEHGKQMVLLGEKDGQLALFNSTSVGEIYDWNGTGDPRYLANIEYQGEEVQILYSNGSYLDNVEEGATVMASFAGRTASRPAVVKVVYGRGGAFFIAIHPEYGSDKLSEIGLHASQENIDGFSEYLLEDLIMQFRPEIIQNEVGAKQEKKLYSFVSDFT